MVVKDFMQNYLDEQYLDRIVAQLNGFINALHYFVEPYEKETHGNNDEM